MPGVTIWKYQGSLILQFFRWKSTAGPQNEDSALFWEAGEGQDLNRGSCLAVVADIFISDAYCIFSWYRGRDHCVWPWLQIYSFGIPMNETVFSFSFWIAFEFGIEDYSSVGSGSSSLVWSILQLWISPLLAPLSGNPKSLRSRPNAKRTKC